MWYASMVGAWAVTEVVRYGFFVVTLAGDGSSGGGSSKIKGDERAGASSASYTSPSLTTSSTASSALDLGRTVLTWARYNTFFLLYPVGIGSEVMCILKAMGEMRRLSGGHVGVSRDGLYGVGWWCCVGILAVYVPGSWVLYTYMMAQRRKMAGKGKGGQSVKVE